MTDSATPTVGSAGGASARAAWPTERPDSSRRHIEPCVRFSLTRLTDILHLAACAAP
jgi:hypothetical protein